MRSLMRAPAFTLVAVWTLAVAIGANTAVFSVLEVVVLRPLPYHEPDALVGIRLVDSLEREHVGADLPLDALDALRLEPALFEDVAGWVAWHPVLSGFGEAEVVTAGAVTDGFLARVLGVQPTLGRSIAPDEHAADGTRTLVLSHAFWLDRLGADPAALGRALILDDVPYTIVGVMPERFRSPSTTPVALWTSARLGTGCMARCPTLRAIGRLRGGVSIPVARDRSTAVVNRLADENPDTYRGTGIEVVRLHDDLFGGVSRALGVLLGAVVLVLLIAVTNVATLQMVRACGRDGEIAVRRALGADRRAIVRRLLVESGVLALLGGGVGVGVAAWGTVALAGLAPSTIHGLESLSMNSRVLGFTAAVALGSAVLSGLVPAVRVALGGVGAMPRRRPPGRRWVGALVAGQVAIAMVLLVASGLLLRSLRELGAADLGFEPDGVLTVRVELPGERSTEATGRVAVYEALLDELARASTAVVSVGATSSLPMKGSDELVEVRIEGDDEDVHEHGEGVSVALRTATPGFFYTMGQAVVDGRSFDAGDRPTASPVAVVNEALARVLFDHPRHSPVGHGVVIGGAGAARRLSVVGVVDDTRHVAARKDPDPALYVPFAQHPIAALTVVVRADGDPMSLADGTREALRSVDGSLTALGVERLSDIVDRTLSADRFAARLLTLLAWCALFLAAVGLYGVVSLGMAHRLREVGVRVAVGARSEDVGRLVLRAGMGLAGPGIVLGSVAALLVGRLLETFLYGVSPVDPVTLLCAAIVMSGVAWAATRAPARSASAVDPVSVLREE